MKIVSNSSPLIALAKIEKLDIIRYEIIIPEAVFNEITRPKKEYVNELYIWAKDKTIEARRIAKLRGLNVIGTIGVLLDAKEKGIISELRPLLDMLISKKIRVSRELYDYALELAGEKPP